MEDCSSCKYMGGHEAAVTAVRETAEDPGWPHVWSRARPLAETEVLRFDVQGLTKWASEVSAPPLVWEGGQQRVTG